MMLEFVLRLTLGRKLRRWFPQLIKDLPMEQIMDSELPYAEVTINPQPTVLFKLLK
jgi:hypothetical protein